MSKRRGDILYIFGAKNEYVLEIRIPPAFPVVVMLNTEQDSISDGKFNIYVLL